MSDNDVDPVSLLPDPNRDPSEMDIDELSKAIAAMRAFRTMRPGAPASQIREKPLPPARIAERRLRCRAAQWCKRAADGYTPTTRPAMQLDQKYDQTTTTPQERHWTFLDPMRSDDVVIDEFTINYPSTELDLVARDLTRAWQLHQTVDDSGVPALSVEDRALLANTPLAVPVDGISAYRYNDLWGQLGRHPLPPTTHWIVRGARIVTVR